MKKITLLMLMACGAFAQDLLPSADIYGRYLFRDNIKIIFGTDSDFDITYDEAIDNRLEVTDGTNLMMYLTDAGTTGNLVVTGTVTATGGLVGDFTDLMITDAATPTLTITDSTTPVTVTFSSDDAEALIQTTTNHPLVLGTNSTDAITISTSQHVGIGIASPFDPLHILTDSGGQAIRVEENSGGEYCLFGTDSSGNLKFTGDANGTTRYFQLNANGGSFKQSYGFGNATNESIIYSDTGSQRFTYAIGHARGSEASPTSTLSGDVLADIAAQGFDTALGTGGLIRFEADANWTTATDRPTRILFNTAPDGSSFVTERMRIDSTGLVTIADDVQIDGGDIFDAAGLAITMLSQDVTIPNGVLSSDTSTTSTAATLKVEQASTGDAVQSFVLGTGTDWMLGIDNSDSDAFKIAPNTSDIGVVPSVVLNTTGDVTLPNSGTTTFGTLDSVRAIFNMHGNATTSGPFIQLNNAGGEDTDTDTWVIHANGSMEINNNSGTSILLDAATNNVDIPNGTLDGGIPSSELYQTTVNPGYTFGIAVTDTWYAIDNFTVGEEDPTYIDADAITDNFTIGTGGGGRYKCFYSISFSGGNSDIYRVGVAIDGADPVAGHYIYRKLGTGGDVGSASGVALMTLTDTDVVTLEIYNESSAADIEIWACNVVLERTGD